MDLEIWHEGRNTTLQIHNSRNPILILTGFSPASLQVVNLNRNTVQSNNYNCLETGHPFSEFVSVENTELKMLEMEREDVRNQSVSLFPSLLSLGFS